MKRILSPILALLALATVVSCNEDVTKQIGTDMKGVLGVVAYEGADELAAETTYEVGKRQVKTISLKAAAEEVSGVALKVTFGTDPSLVEAYNKANGTSYEMLPGEAFSFGESDVIMPRFNQYSAESKLTLIGQGCVENQLYLLPVTITKVIGSDNYAFSETKNVIYFLMKVLPSNKGTGTKLDPFLIQELEDITTMHEKLIPGEMIYFKMEADIDMTPVTSWAALNVASPYDKGIVFDGNGHTISNFTAEGGAYTSFFGVLYGSVENLTFENATIIATSDVSGVVAGYLGTNGKHATAKNIKIVNSTNNTTNKQHTGILCGRTADSVIENIYIENCVVVGKRYAGLVAACDANPGTTIRNCYVKGGKVTGSQQVGSIMGMIEHESVIDNCGTSAEVHGEFGLGGILGRASAANPSKGKVKTVTNCLVWSPMVWAKAVFPGTFDHYSSGVVVGTARKGEAPFTFKNCVYRADIKFQDYTDQNPLVDSPDVENGQVSQAAAGGDHNYPWNGVASSAKTASDAAKALGWDETIWDLSGAEPKLK